MSCYLHGIRQSVNKHGTNIQEPYLLLQTWALGVDSYNFIVQYSIMLQNRYKQLV